MKIYSTNYQNTFIEIAEDCPAATGTVPPIKKAGKTAAAIQYELIAKNPYRYTSDDVLFQCYILKNDIQHTALSAAREQFFSKGQPCFRASPLPKQYGWGIHYNEAGKMAVYGYETAEYRAFVHDNKVKKIKAMSQKRKQSFGGKTKIGARV